MSRRSVPTWHGWGWSRMARCGSRERLALYDAAFETLRAVGRVYPAYETQQELELKRKIQLGRGLPPLYDRAALALGDAERAEKEATGISPHWRFRLDHDAPITWDDGVRGTQSFDPALLSDPVVRRADGSWLYMLPSAADDIAMGVTDVLRGEDHVSNTAVQIQMFEALNAAGFAAQHGAAKTDAPHPRFAHEALLVGIEGKLSKRLGSIGCDTFREQGVEPQALVALLARLGTSQPVEAIADRGVLVEGFDLSTFGRAPAKFDEVELTRVNTTLIHTMDYDAAADRLPDGMDEAAWHAIRPNLETLAEAADWWRMVTGPIDLPDFSDEDRAFLGEAAAALEWGDDPWGALTATLKNQTGRKGKPLFLPLRQAFTGANSGPDMGALLPVIGEDAARRRLARAAGR